MTKNYSCIVVIALLSAFGSMPCYGKEIGNGFDNEKALTTTTLSSTVANSHVSVGHNVTWANQGNVISEGALKGAIGIIAINQNTGSNASVQQSVVVKANTVSFDLSN